MRVCGKRGGGVSPGTDDARQAAGRKHADAGKRNARRNDPQAAPAIREILFLPHDFNGIDDRDREGRVGAGSRHEIEVHRAGCQDTGELADNRAR